MRIFQRLNGKAAGASVYAFALCFVVGMLTGSCGRHGAPQERASGSAPDAALAGRFPVEVVASTPVTDPLFREHRSTTATAEWPGCLQAGLDSLLRDDLFRSTQVGLCVYDLTTDSLLFSLNPRHRLRPASTAKVITAVSGLALLGGGHSFQTRLYVTGSVSDGVLRGDVYAVGGFDPCFGRDDMEAFVASLKGMGVDSIAGCLYADVSMKDTLMWGWGWCWDDDNYTLTPLPYDKQDRFQEAWFEQLAAQGIAAADRRRLSALCPPEARLVIIRSHSFDQVLLDMMKDSDNFYAEAVFYQLAARSGRRYVSRKQAVQEINALIEKMGLQPAHYQIADGSGLSLYNYLTPELEVAFLRHAYRDKNIYNHLYPSLPVAGLDGTLKRRMTSGPAHLNVRAKTGTVEGVSALAGYATAANGHMLAFSIMNQGVVRARAGRNFQDKVCTLLCQ